MKDLFTVTKFTMKDMLQRKSFIITTIIFLVMIIIGFNIPNFIKMLNKDSDVNKILNVVLNIHIALVHILISYFTYLINIYRILHYIALFNNIFLYFNLVISK